MTLIRGLEGVIATSSSISAIIDDTLTYVGYKIEDLAEFASFEEIVYLLWHLELPNKEQLAEIKIKLAEASDLPEELHTFLRNNNLQDAHPMTILRTAVSILGMYDPESEDMSKEANYRKAIRLQAQIATLVAAFSRYRKGLQPIAPRKDLSYASNFLHMMNGKQPSALEEEAFNKALVLHADHELNASTFTARVCVGTLSDMYSGVTSAIGALKGPLHGGANENVMKMLLEIGEVQNVDTFINDALENKKKIMGFGHRVYRKGDPRAAILKEMSRQLCIITGQQEYFKMSEKIEQKMTSEKNIPPNVDFYSATVYNSLEIETDLFTPIFAVSRMSGWVAHILEQYENNRLIRPRADYTGPQTQKFIPIEKRA